MYLIHRIQRAREGHENILCKNCFQKVVIFIGKTRQKKFMVTLYFWL